MNKIQLEQLCKKYPIPSQYKRQNQRDKHDFNDLYITATTKRFKAMRRNCVLFKKKAMINKKFGFWVDVE